MENKLPRYGGRGASMDLHHAQHCGTDVSVLVPADIRELNQEAISLLNEVKRLLNYSVSDVSQTVESTDDNGVNIITFTMKDGTEKQFRIRNGRPGVDGNLPEIEDAIERANEAASKIDEVKTLKEAYKSMVVRGLMDDEEIGDIVWNPYDPQKYVAWDREQTLGIDQQDQARENINAASQTEFAQLQEYAKGLREDHDTYVGVYEKLSAAFRAKLEAAGYVSGTPYVWFALQYLFDEAGLLTALDTTAQTTNPAVNEVLAEIPEIEDSDINMVQDVFI